MAFYVDEEQVWKCLKHPSKRRKTGICPTCLHERLIALCPECANTLPCSCYSSSLEQTARMSTFIENEPAFRKSRSLAVPILRSRSNDVDVNRSKVTFWSVFKPSKSRKCDLRDHESMKSEVLGVADDYSRMMRSRSVAVDDDSLGTTTMKRRGWYLPSPMKAFRQPKTSELQIHEPAPMH